MIKRERERERERERVRKRGEKLENKNSVEQMGRRLEMIIVYLHTSKYWRAIFKKCLLCKYGARVCVGNI
jgi:hypothetical protein